MAIDFSNLLNSLSTTLHVAAAVIWVGGMFFAYMALRPAAAETLESPQRLTLWAKTFARFFPWVLAMVVILPVTGTIMILNFKIVLTGMYHVHLMITLGTIMILIFLHVFFAPYNRLKRAVQNQDWEAGARSLGQIRMLVGINLILGLIVVMSSSFFSLPSIFL